MNGNDNKAKRITWSHDYVIRRHIGKEIGLLFPDHVELRAVLVNCDKYSVLVRLPDSREVLFQKHAFDGINFGEAVVGGE